MQKFEMPFDNTCTKCAEPIKAGAEVFAANMDEVIAGKGVCRQCAKGDKNQKSPKNQATGSGEQAGQGKEAKKVPAKKTAKKRSRSQKK